MFSFNVSSSNLSLPSEAVLRGEGRRTVIPASGYYIKNKSEPILWVRPKLTESVVPERVRKQMQDMGFDAMLAGPNRDRTIRVTLTPKLGSDRRMSTRAVKRFSSFASHVPFIPTERPSKQSCRSCINQFLLFHKD